MTGRFVATPNVERILGREPATIAALTKATAAVLGEAKRAADPVSGRFKEGLTMDVGTDSSGALGRVIATWPFSLFVEFGNAHQTPRPVLRQALDASQGKALRR